MSGGVPPSQITNESYEAHNSTRLQAYAFTYSKYSYMNSLNSGAFTRWYGSSLYLCVALHLRAQATARKWSVGFICSSDASCLQWPEKVQAPDGHCLTPLVAEALQRGTPTHTCAGAGTTRLGRLLSCEWAANSHMGLAPHCKLVCKCWCGLAPVTCIMFQGCFKGNKDYMRTSLYT